MNIQLTIYHRGEINTVNQILALAESDKVKAIEKNICEIKLTGTQLLQLSNKMGVALNDLVDKKSKLYPTIIQNSKFDEEGWISIYTQYPELIKTPFAETEKEIISITTPTDVLKLKNIDKSIDAYQHTKNQSN